MCPILLAILLAIELSLKKNHLTCEYKYLVEENCWSYYGVI